MKRKILISFIILLFLLSTTVFGVDSQPEDINSDLSLAQDAYSLISKVAGNAFIAVKDFEVADNVIVDGDLFVVANTVTLKSNVTYSDAIAKDGEYSIDKINSHASIQGNAYIVCKELTLEPGAEISGDLYVVAQKINMQKSSSIGRNIFAVANTFNLNGRVYNSVYATTQNFNMNYFGSIDKDLNLSSDRINLSSVIHRNANIDANLLETTSNFLLYGNLDAAAETVNYSGEVHGNAVIKTKSLNFVTSTEDATNKCLIEGHLDYSTPKELSIDNSIVKGEITYSKYHESSSNEPGFSIKDFIVSLITFVLYIFVIVWLFKLFAKNYSSEERKITVKDTFVELGIGLLSIIAVSVAAIILLLINIGTTLGFALIIAYALILFLSTPLLVLDIANLLKNKLKFYLIVPLIALVLFLIGKIPVLGGLVMFLFTMIGTGRIIRNLITKK